MRTIVLKRTITARKIDTCFLGFQCDIMMIQQMEESVMTNPRFIQIHTLHSYTGALLNRDEHGWAKQLPYGGVTRTRISSQCLKRHWRMADDEYAISNVAYSVDAVRSRKVVKNKITDPMRKNGLAVSDAVIDAVGSALTDGLYGTGKKKEKEEGNQVMLFGYPEIEYLKHKAEAICLDYPNDDKAATKAVERLFSKEEKNNFSAFRESVRLPGGLVGALFGRMVTSDTSANIDAPVHVAHSYTVHEHESETDYWTAVDDLHEEETGSAGIGEADMNSGLYYGYVNIDVPGLVSNLEGCNATDWLNADRNMAANVVNHLIHLIATVSPGAKVGSTAPYGWARFMLIEAGSMQPCTYDGAFRNPVSANVEDAMEALYWEIHRRDSCYGFKGARWYMSMEDCIMPNAERSNINDMASWVSDAIRNRAV